MANKMSTSINYIAYNNYIRYERLQELINYIYMDSSEAEEINLYIDVYPIIRSIYADTYDVSYDGFMDLVPLLINMCAHYRYFFRRYYNVETVIYLVVSKNIPEYAQKLVPGYNDQMNTRLNSPTHSIMDEMLDTNFKIMNVLSPYLPNIHFVISENKIETSVIIGYIIEHQMNKSIPNLVISKDLYPIQLVSHERFNNTTFLMPLKNSVGDVSVIVGSSMNPQYWYDFWSLYITKKKISANLKDFIFPANISPILSLSGMSERHVKALMRFDGIYNKIYSLIGNNPIQCSIDTIYDQFPKIEATIPKYLVENRFHVFDIPYQIDTNYSITSEALLMHFENKYDAYTVRQLCDKYFTNIPISLDKL